MSDRKKLICIACGGSAGHIFPGLALAEELTKRYGEGIKILFLTSDNKLARSLFADSGFNFYTLPLKGIKKRAIHENPGFILSLFKGTFKSMRIIFANRPDCFVGFGSYAAGPPFVIASLLRVPTIIHEQNVSMGRANRIMRRFATKVALGFSEKSCGEGRNVVFTGNPIRKSIAKVHDKTSAVTSLGMSRDRFTILIIGGSQGSRTVNSAAAGIFERMEKQLRGRIQVIHISGENDYERLKRLYRRLDILYRLYPFFKDMGLVYSAADISISRAGASTIGELCIHKIPAILIPYPYARSHQVQNAGFLAERKAAIAIEENKLSETYLLEEVKKLLNSHELRESMSQKMGSLAVHAAAKKLADEVSALL